MTEMQLYSSEVVTDNRISEPDMATSDYSYNDGSEQNTILVSCDRSNCYFTTNNVSLVFLHIASHQTLDKIKPSTFQCPMAGCQYITKLPMHLRVHYTRKHPIALGTIINLRAPERITRATTVARHDYSKKSLSRTFLTQEVPTEKQGVECPIVGCSVILSSPDAIKRHYIEFHPTREKSSTNTE